jgi:predicted GNAT family acetyltransferase
MIKIHDTAKEFLAFSRNLLEEKEAENNLILGLAATLTKQSDYYSDERPLFFTRSHELKCVFAALQTPPYNLIIYGAEDHLEESISEVCEHLLQNGKEIPGVIGPRDTAMQFIEKWKTMNEGINFHQMDQLVYKLQKLIAVEPSKGYLRQAERPDLDIVASWLMNFNEEAMETISEKAAIDLALKKIEEGVIFLWIDRSPVSMAASVRPTRNGITISYVYTPDVFRQKGYASSCVAALSKLMLKNHKFCTLFTDAKNPTSNKLYQRMGYEARDRVMYCRFCY